MKKRIVFNGALMLACASLATALVIPGALAAADSTAFRDTKQIEARASALLRQMTLAEKAGQLSQFSFGNATGPEGNKIDHFALAAQGRVGAILNLSGAEACNNLQRQAVEKSRLKIPILFGLDVIHGYRTPYPIPLALSATWDPQVAERCARMAAVEATAEGIRWTFSPMIDIARDPRWGRITEGNGEDPWLGAQFAAAWVRGYQGTNLADLDTMVACPKHYVAYGGAEGGRDYNTVDMSERVLRDVYLPPFKAALDAGAGTFMSAFDALQGVPASANHHTLTDILRTEWGFRGFVVSDWEAVGELVPHGIALDGSEAAVKALNAGVDMDMQSDLYDTRLEGLVKNGRLKMKVVDEAVLRVLRVKFALGLFEHPYTEVKPPPAAANPEYVALVRRAAEKSLVLLKNDAVNGGPLLPLSEDRTVALIGKLADDRGNMLGTACPVRGKWDDIITLREALAARLKDKLIYAKGVGPVDDPKDDFSEALAAAGRADVVVMALGETRDMSGEAASRARLDLPGKQLKLLQAVVETGKPVVLVLFNGRPLALPWEAAHVPAILEAWFPGMQAGPAVVRALYGDVNPAGKITASFPRSTGQVPVYYNAFNTGRPSPGKDRFVTGYIDESNQPLYPFGWGLSYTKFTYSATSMATPTISATELNRGGAIMVEATVANSGLRAGVETAQLYIRQRGTTVARPVRELKGFERLTLAPGEQRRVSFVLTKKELAFWNIDLQHVVEPGELTVWVAPDSQGGTPVKVMIKP